jgi:hypothetical protein
MQIEIYLIKTFFFKLNKLVMNHSFFLLLAFQF